jgi:hypothetical protein
MDIISVLANVRFNEKECTIRLPGRRLTKKYDEEGLCVAGEGTYGQSPKIAIVKYENLIQAEPDLVQLYVYGDHIRAYSYPDRMYIYNNGTFIPAIQLYDTYVDDDKLVVNRSYVNQALVDDNLKITTVLKAELDVDNNIVHDIQFTDLTVVKKAIYWLDNEYRIHATNTNLIEILTYCGYVAVGEDIFALDKSYSAYIAMNMMKMVSVTMAVSKYDAHEAFKLNNVTFTDIIQVDEDEVAIAHDAK